MAILTTLNLLSEQRLDISDVRRLESAVRNDFDTLVTSVLTNTSQGYIIRGFSVVTAGSIGSPANGLQMKVDPGAVLHIAASVSGTIFQTPAGTVNQVLNAASNTNVSGSFTANSTNYVGIDYDRFADPTTNVTKYIWNASAKDEIKTIAPAAQTLTFKIFITTSVWAANVLPVAIVRTDGNGNVLSITDARWMFYSLETGGINPNPNHVYPWTLGRNQPPVTTTSNAVDPFNGGDKQLDSQKAWDDAIASIIKEIRGTPQWFSGPAGGGGGPFPSLTSIFQDLGNTVITGSGEISNGILPNSDPILITTGNILTGSNQFTSLGSVVGLAAGNVIFGVGIPQGTTIISIVGSTVTMSLEATLTGTGISTRFFNPAVITAPGQINWNDPISIRVIGSSLTYTLSANPSSANVTLADDQVAYIILDRDISIVPNLIFVGGSPIVVSVGPVTWTTGLLPGDYIKIASNTVSDYYKILTVDSGSQVTLTTNVVIGDNTGVGGAQAQSAFGSYHASPTPIGDSRAIQISARSAVPVGGNVFWLFLREDNGGAPRVYIRFLAQELDNGESVEVSGTTSLELLTYIGSPSAAASKPQYSSALNPGSLPQITGITVGAAASVASNQYFFFNSSGNSRKYAVWINKDGTGIQPVVPGVNAYIEWDVTTGQTAAQVAAQLVSALNSTPNEDFSSSSIGAVLTVNNTSAGAAVNGVNFNVGAPFAISVSQPGTGVGNFVIHDGDNLTLAIKELDQALANIDFLLDEPSYDEAVSIVASGATPPTSLNGPISAFTIITLPNNSRMGDVSQKYTVGNGVLEVYLNGQYLHLSANDSGPVSVLWAHLTNFTAIGSQLTKTVSGVENAFAYSDQSFNSIAGHIDIVIPAGAQASAGLTDITGFTPPDGQYIRYSMVSDTVNTYAAYYGILAGGLGPYLSTDVFTIDVDSGGVVKYKKNNATFYTSPHSATGLTLFPAATGTATGIMVTSAAISYSGVAPGSGGDWSEVGAPQTPSNQIEILQSLSVGDLLEFRIDATGGPGSGGGAPGPSGPPGPAGPPGADEAGGPIAISTKTSNYTVLLTDNFLKADTTGGSIIFTLPPVATATGRIFNFKKIDSSANAMTIQGNGADLIDGFNTQFTNTQYESFSIISDGLTWNLF